MLEDYVNIFNRRKLFLGFNGLQKGYIEKQVGKKTMGKVLTKHNLFNHYFNEYKYHLYSVYYFLEQIEQLENAIMNQYKNLRSSIEFHNEYKIEYDSFIVHEYMLRIMPFLNTMFILQDRLMILIAIFLDLEFKDPIKKPNESDREYKNKIKKFRNKLQSFTSYANNYLGILEVFPDRISALTKKYWKQNGQELRKYRNLEQHQFNLLEEAYIIRKPTERFILYLPDNPNERDFEKLTYHKKIVAIDFFKFEIQVFHDFVEDVMETIGIKAENHEFGSNFSPKTNFIKQYNEGDLMKIWVIKNEAILFSVGEKTPDGTAAKLNMRKIENKMNILRWEIK